MKTIISKASPVIWVSFFIFSLLACSDDTPEPDQGDRYVFIAPDHFPEPTYTFDNNPITKDGFLLGKELFYDPILSRDGSVSCNNCHIQSTTFADSPVHPLSIGIENRLGMRNAPPLTNLAFYPEFFWDGGVTHLDFVPINAIESEVEMDETLEGLVEKLNASDRYKALYKKAFDIEEITLPFTLHALSQFTNMMISDQSKYDHYLRGKATLSTIEKQGLSLFQDKCATCHAGTLFTDFSYRNNGLDSAFADTGRQRITSLDSDIGKFRVPSLRNVQRTAPYMHNARYQTLMEVLDHYDAGMVHSQTLDQLFSNDGRLGIQLSEDDKTALVAFLHTLTDYEFVQDTLFFSN